jgi:predicted transcriptional regulator
MALKTNEKTMVSAQFPRDLVTRLAELARAHDRSMSAEIRRAVGEHLERAETTEGAAG